MNELVLKIADFTIKIFTRKPNIDFLISENYEPFKIKNTGLPDISIELIPGFPDWFKNSKELFKAEHEGSDNDSAYFWSINQFVDHKIIFTSDPGFTKFPVLALVLTNKSKNWKMYLPEVAYLKSYKVDPFLYPMGPLIMYYITAFNNAVMIHGSGINYQSGGIVFSGVSGVGKSTMAEIWKNNGAEIINDDRLIVRKMDNQFYFYNTPMYYPDGPKKGLLKKLFLIKHGQKNRANKLNTINAITKTMANCIHHGYDKSLINSLLETLGEICAELPVYELEFLPDNSIFTYINQL